MSSRLLGTFLMGVLSVCGAMRSVPSAVAAEEPEVVSVQPWFDNGVTDPVEILPSQLEPQLALADDVQFFLEPATDSVSDNADQPAADDSAAIDDSDAAIPADDTDEAAPATEAAADEQPAEIPAAMTDEEAGEALMSEFVDPFLQWVDEVSQFIVAILYPAAPTSNDHAEAATIDESTAPADAEPAAATEEVAPVVTTLGDVNDPETPWFDSADLGTEFEGTLRPEMLDVYWANIPLDETGSPVLSLDEENRMYDQIDLCFDLFSRDDLSDEQIQKLAATIIAQTALLDFALTGIDLHHELFAILDDIGPGKV